MQVNLPDYILLECYRAWSEENFCAGFISPTKQHVSDFRQWLMQKQGRDRLKTIPVLFNYESRFLELYHDLESSEVSRE